MSGPERLLFEDEDSEDERKPAGDLQRMKNVSTVDFEETKKELQQSESQSEERH